MSAEELSVAALFGAALFSAWMRASAPVILAALGGLLSDLAGAINVALEGAMLVGALFGVLGAVYAVQWFPGLPAAAAPWVGCLAGVLAATALALLLACFHLHFGAHLIVAGIVMNMLAAGATVFLMVTLTGDKGSTAGVASPVLPSLRIPGLQQWPVIDAWINGEGGAGHHVLIHAAFGLAALLALLVFRTRWGLRLRAVGENREAALAAGLPVRRIQYGAFAASGALAGLGGVYLSMGYLSLFQADMTAGRGFLALAAVFLGARQPLGTLGAALLFGASAVLATQLGLLHIPNQIVFMVPPVVTMVALAVVGRRVRRKSATPSF